MHTTETDFVPGKPRLAYDHTGKGPAVVFMHGIGGNRTNWCYQLAALAADFHAVAWDARGYGLSDDYDGPLDFADFSHDLRRLLDRLGVGAAHICGLSMGGRIAQDFYSRYPDRVATLVLCDTFASFDATFKPEKRAEFVRLRKEPLLQGKEPRDIAAQVARSLLSPKSPHAAYERLVESMSALHKASYIKTIEATTMYDKSAALSRIAVPTLLVYGSDDRLTPPAIGSDMASRIPGAKMVVVEDAGHLPNIEKPDEFNAILRAFLAEHRDRAN
jgi:3-oxoadipate enol-lactonase